MILMSFQSQKYFQLNWLKNIIKNGLFYQARMKLLSASFTSLLPEGIYGPKTVGPRIIWALDDRWLPEGQSNTSDKDVDSKLRHSGRFYIKLKVDEGSKLGDLFLTNNSGK